MIERAAAAEERKLNETRWRNLEERQKIAAEHLKELVEKQEITRISIENENASRKRQERGWSSWMSLCWILLIIRRESSEAGFRFHSR